jgi:flagellar motor switch protein FliN/FliY
MTDEIGTVTADNVVATETLQQSPEDVVSEGVMEAPTVSPAEFQPLSQPADRPQPKNIDLLMDVNLPLSIELGRTKMSIAEILSLGPGSVVELNKLAGEPVDVLVNNKIVAKGEVVVIDEYFGVRITQLMTPQERLKLLGEEQ